MKKHSLPGKVINCASFFSSPAGSQLNLYESFLTVKSFYMVTLKFADEKITQSTNMEGYLHVPA
jgi:hypothetical protein